jgi:hypothetical protein
MGRSHLSRNARPLRRCRKLSRVRDVASIEPNEAENHAEIVKFREMLEHRFERNDPPLTVIPEEHQPVIAKMAHERFFFLNRNWNKDLIIYTATKLYLRSQNISIRNFPLFKMKTKNPSPHLRHSASLF